MSTQNTKVGLAREAYQGAPVGYAHVWPEMVDHPSKWSREHWSWDSDQVIRRRGWRKRITTAEATDLVTRMLKELTEKKGK